MSSTSLAERASASLDAQGTGQSKTMVDALEDPEFKKRVQRVIPNMVNVDRLVRISLNVIGKSQQLRRCTQASVLGAVMTSAQLGLEPDVRGLAYLVPRYNSSSGCHEATFMIGYRGYIDLARRSGQISDIHAHVVYEHDDFDFQYGTAASLRHRPKLTGDRGALLAVYACATFANGGHNFVVLTTDEVEARRKRSDASNSGRSPWTTDRDAMYRKTAVRALASYLPQSIELAQAVRLDEQVRLDIDSSLEDAEPVEVPDDVADAELVDEPQGEEGQGQLEARVDSRPAGSPQPETGEVDGEVHPASEANESTSSTEPDLYEAMDTNALRTECEANDLAATGTPKVMRERLRDWAADMATRPEV